jgi:hypothetical protein
VAERSAHWAQLRAHKLEQLTHQRRRAEACECTFRPASGAAPAHSGAYASIAAGDGGVGAPSSSRSVLEVAARSSAWLQQKQLRLEAARAEVLRREAEEGMRARAASTHSAAHRSASTADGGDCTDISVSHAAGAEAEPRYMAPTASARERVSGAHVAAASYAAGVHDAGFAGWGGTREESEAHMPPPPEWAAPMQAPRAAHADESPHPAGLAVVSLT